MQSSTDEAAIVIGGSMAGLLAARVLTDHFGRVTVIDRDRFPIRPGFRKGVPQSRHPHALLARGQEVIEGFFPGIVGELLADGAVNVNAPADILSLTRFGWGPRYPGLRVLSMSRELLEFHVRRRLAMSPTVDLIEDNDVVDLIHVDGSIDGVVIQPRIEPGAPSHDATTEAGSIIVDASGRGSRTPEWLRVLGYDPPRETKILSHAGYASRYYAQPDDFAADWKLLFFFPSPEHPRGGVLFPIEGRRWLVTLIGMGGDYPPTDDAGFLGFAKTLQTPMLHNVIRDATPIGPIRGYRRTENVLRHYEDIAHRPARLVVVGDAACAFNPIYGQGMTVASLQALALDRWLHDEPGSRRREPAAAARFQKAVSTISAVAWRLATSADRQYPTTEGTRSGRTNRMLGSYLDRLQRVATRDRVVASAFRNVTQLLVPPSALFAPGVLLRVLTPRRIEPRERPPTTAPFGA